MQSQVNTFSILSWADWVVFVIVLCTTAGAAWYGAYRLRQRTENGPQSALDYLLMGRQLTLPFFIATLVATWYGGIFGVSEITFNYGIFNFITQGFFWYISYLIFAFFIAKRVVNSRAQTLPDLSQRLFGPRAAVTTAWFTLLTMLPVAYALSVGIFLHMVFGISVMTGMIIGTLFVGLYSAWGGLRSVVLSDTVQFVVMCTAVAVVFAFSIGNFGGIGFLKAHLPASHFSLTGGHSWANTLVWGFIALSTLIDPNFYQRCFAAKDLKTVKTGILISTIIWFLFDICTTAGALYARALLPEAQPAEAYFFYALQLLPGGLRGLFVAGILSLILSTLSSYLFVASNTLSFDLLKNRFPNVVRSNRAMVFIAGGLAILLAHLLHGSFKEIWLVIGSYFSACLLVPVLVGEVRPGVLSEKAFNISCWSSAVMMTLYRFLAPSSWVKQFDPFYVGVAVSVLILLCCGKGVFNARVTGR